jgi:hypothetical protein
MAVFANVVTVIQLFEEIKELTQRSSGGNTEFHRVCFPYALCPVL